MKHAAILDVGILADADANTSPRITAFIQTLEFSPISTSPTIWADSSI